ncbi:MAG: hypothetical protein AAF569_08995, partial [Pseudomonadota bacterium]
MEKIKTADTQLIISLEKKDDNYSIKFESLNNKSTSHTYLYKKDLLSMETQDTTENKEICMNIGRLVLADLMVANTDFLEPNLRSGEKLVEPEGRKREEFTVKLDYIDVHGVNHNCLCTILEPLADFYNETFYYSQIIFSEGINIGKPPLSSMGKMDTALSSIELMQTVIEYETEDRVIQESKDKAEA